jgi:hypothetical protein
MLRELVRLTDLTDDELIDRTGRGLPLVEMELARRLVFARGRVAELTRTIENMTRVAEGHAPIEPEEGWRED